MELQASRFHLSAPGKVMEKITVQTLHMENSQVTDENQHGFIKCKSCQTHFVNFYNKDYSIGE